MELSWFLGLLCSLPPYFSLSLSLSLSLSASQASDVKDLPRGLLLGLMLYSFCNESEEPELQES